MNPQSLSIAQVKSSISQKFREIVPRETRSFSQTNSRILKNFISLCTSVSIRFMQYDLMNDTLEVLIKASEADRMLCEQGTFSDLQWPGRLLTYHTLAFLYYKTNQIKKSLKVLHDGQLIIDSILNAKQAVSLDITFTENLLIFMNLWKAKKVKEAKEYLELSKAILSKISKIGMKSRISLLSKANLSGLLALSSAGILCYENSPKKSLEICEHSLEYLLGDEVMVRPLLHSFIKKLRNNEYLQTEWVTNKDFDGIVLVSCLIPFISPGTPSLKIIEHVEVHGKSSSRNTTAISSKRTNSLPVSRIKIRNVQTQNKPWWNNKAFVSKTMIKTRRASEGRRISTGSSMNFSFEYKVSRDKHKVYSPSVGSELSTSRRKPMKNRSETMAELPLQLIKGVSHRPFSSK